MSDKYPILVFFNYSHLPPNLQEVSRPFAELALRMAETLSPTVHQAELAAGLRKLLEAKDCLVRAHLGTIVTAGPVGPSE